MMSWPSLNRSASTTNVSPTSRLTGYRPPSSSGVTLSMTTDRNVVGMPSPGMVPFPDWGDLALLAVFDVLRGAVAAPAAAGVFSGLAARARVGGLRAGVVMHSGYHHHIPGVANLTRRFLATCACPVGRCRRIAR